jgi:L-ascorbate metabolism protein UlaG (beta-lactamase superfamily)
MKIDYLGHSGFFVETDSVLLLFDYYYGDLSFIGQKPDEKPLFVFASHIHEDHYNPKIFSLSDIHPRTTYLLSFDIKGDPGVPEDYDVQYLDADKTYEIEGLGTVMTFYSTDEGIAFLVKTPCATLFHAGDLHY